MRCGIDEGTDFDSLKPNLIEEGVVFEYPQATITNLKDLCKAFEASWSTTKASSHDIKNIDVLKTGKPDTYIVVAPHTYLMEKKDGNSSKIDIFSRMKVQTGVVTKADPTGSEPKIAKYVVQYDGRKEEPVATEIEAAMLEGISANDAKAFVHKWFAAADSKNAAAMIAMTSDEALDVNLLGTQIQSKEELEQYLVANGDYQAWATHEPSSISVVKTKEGFDVRFTVHFNGLIKNTGEILLNNVTKWSLVNENGELKLKSYSLELI